MKKFVLWLCSSLLFLLLAASITLGVAIFRFGQPGPNNKEITVVIPPGSGFRAITKELAQQGVIADPLIFQGMVMLNAQAKNFKAGEYAFAPHVTPKRVMDALVKGEVVTHAITIAEGLTTAEAMAIIAAEPLLSGTLPGGVAEGSLLPETYHFHREDSRALIVERMQKAQQKLLAKHWPARQQNLPYDTPEAALTLASIVEKETGVANERGRIAAVFVNRLRMGMPLQSDPTVIYGIELEKGEPLGRPLWRKDLKIDHPYNTYVHGGLPPGPIANPGKAAILAVLNPPSSKELYFVATGNGGHHFAETLREHNANVARYKAVLKENN